MASSWLAIHVGLDGITTEDDPRADLLSNTLFELGAEGLEWRTTAEGFEAVAAVAATAKETEGLMAQVWQDVLAVELPVSWVRIEPFADIDWSSHWKEHFAPLRFGASEIPAEEAIWVVPSWLEPPKEAHKTLRIDPSSAFGTGLHPTTALCVEWLMANRPESVLDVGTGTGILAFVAALCGGQRIVGTDNDPEAIRVAIENRTLNGFKATLPEFFVDSLDHVEGSFTGVVANVLAQPLIDLAPQVVAHMAPGAQLALSGLLVTQVDEVSKVYHDLGLKTEMVASSGEWARVDLCQS